MHRLPSGMITLSDGAFSNSSVDFFVNNLLPVHDYASTVQQKKAKSAPSNTLSPDTLTVYEWINANVTGYKEPQKCMNGGECRSAVFFNHYARGTDWWGTADLPWYYQLGIAMNIADSIKDAFGTPERGSKTLDETPTHEAVNFLTKYYPATNNGNTGDPSQYDKSKRFPALFTVYYGGPDHYAHDAGMDGSTPNYTGYKDYFQKKTDAEIAKVVSKLKDVDEYDNKIFIIVADHGMTAMPTGMTYKYKLEVMPDSGIYSEMPQPAETSCTLKTNFEIDPKSPEAGENNRKAERANNNLHIWELGEVMRSIGEQGWNQYKVLAPKEIAQLYKDKDQVELPFGATADIAKANVIAALNGPMAHIYLKGASGWGDKNVDIVELAKLAGRLKTYLMEGGQDLKKKEKSKFTRLLSSVDTILIREGGAYKIFNGVLTDAAGNISGPDVVQIDETTFNADIYIKSFIRITGMNHPDRSGDIVLIFNDFTDDVLDNRYTSGVACKSWHGSLSPSDSYVPLIVAYPGGNKSELDPIIQKACTNSVCEGNWKVTDIILEAIKKQYIGN